jgi:hypothetical protein
MVARLRKVRILLNADLSFFAGEVIAAFERRRFVVTASS